MDSFNDEDVATDVSTPCNSDTLNRTYIVPLHAVYKTKQIQVAEKQRLWLNKPCPASIMADEKMKAKTRKYRMSTIMDVILRDIKTLFLSLSDLAPRQAVSDCISIPLIRDIPKSRDSIIVQNSDMTTNIVLSVGGSPL